MTSTFPQKQPVLNMVTESASTDEEEMHAEHFQSLEQQQVAARLGMWVFLGSETLLFAGLIGLFWTYAVGHWHSFQEAAHHNLSLLATAMTVVLLVSSFFVAWAQHSLQRAQRSSAFWSLIATALLGASFLAMKAYEYNTHFQNGIYPGASYSFEKLPHDGAQLFFTLYYFLTGLHALHVFGGIILILVLAILLRRGHFSAKKHSALENGGLYWHLVDVVWLFLWPMLYLM